jgi:hypothetical protein
MARSAIDLGMQHDDHIWLTAAGEGWAIERIEDGAQGTRVCLWRGYEPNLDRVTVRWPKTHWPAYAERAATLLDAQ